MKNSVLERIAAVKSHCAALAFSSDGQRSELIGRMAEGLIRDSAAIFSANKADLENAASCSEAVRHRLLFDEAKLDGVASSLREVAALPDPVGRVLMRNQLDDNLLLEKISVPIGVVGMVFEARPDALVQIASLCLKSGNCLVLKGGSEAVMTNRALFRSIRNSCAESFIGPGWLELLESHEDVKVMLAADGLIDLVIPRGSNKFVKHVMSSTSIPVLGHSDGLCSMYIDKSAFIGKAVACALDAKVNYPAACNSIENLIVHRDIAAQFIPMMAKAYRENNVEILGDRAVAKLIPCRIASSSDWDTEYLGLKISIKIVSDIDEALEFIARHSSHHTDAIIAEDEDAQRRFLSSVDSADVFCNCSTRFADGYRFGLGAEVGISTSKVHARGPVGLEGLMTTKFLLKGQGQVAQTYTGRQARAFKHIDLGADGPSLILKAGNGRCNQGENGGSQ